MRLLCLWPTTAGFAQPRIIALWGLGLIGRAIYEQLRSFGLSGDQEYAFPWQGEKAQIEAAAIILQAILRQVAEGKKRGTPSVALIWSAGKKGFSATEAETSQEMRPFKVILNLAQELRDRLPGIRVEFHLMSSAGGIFEDCRYVEPGTSPSPCRPYGYYKLDQEQALLNARGLVPYIYRPSSVYGPIRSEARWGLIPILIHHGLLQQVIQVFGTPTTLRDYVYVGDVASYVADRLILNPAPKYTEPVRAELVEAHSIFALRQAQGERLCKGRVNGGDRNEEAGEIFWLVAGRTFSILEVKHLVERVLRHRLYLAMHYDPVNSRDIAFSPRLRPTAFQPTALDIGIALVYHRWLSSKG